MHRLLRLPRRKIRWERLQNKNTACTRWRGKRKNPNGGSDGSCGERGGISVHQSDCREFSTSRFCLFNEPGTANQIVPRLIYKQRKDSNGVDRGVSLRRESRGSGELLQGLDVLFCMGFVSSEREGGERESMRNSSTEYSLYVLCMQRTREEVNSRLRIPRVFLLCLRSCRLPSLLLACRMSLVARQ